MAWKIRCSRMVSVGMKRSSWCTNPTKLKYRPSISLLFLREREKIENQVDDEYLHKWEKTY